MQEIKTRYKIIDVAADGGLLTTKKFSYKIPESFVFVDAIYISIFGDGIPANNIIIGRLSLNFNSKASTPIVRFVRTDKSIYKKRKFGFLKLAEPLVGGTNIDGYLYNFMALPAGAKVKIYLKGKQVYS